MIDPKEDGISHINVYSQGKTRLGQFLSNFYVHQIETEDGSFNTIEGYWYWLSVKDDRLRTTNGWESKQLGRKLKGSDWNDTPEFQSKILKAIALKISSHPETLQNLLNNDLPFLHYYVYNEKVIMPKDGLWMISFIKEFQDELKRGIK